LRAVIAYRSDLLGSRLLNLLHAWSFALASDRSLVLIWPDQTPFHPGSFGFHDIFDAEGLAEAAPDLTVIPSDEIGEINRRLGVNWSGLQDLPSVTSLPGDPARWKEGPDAVLYRATGSAWISPDAALRAREEAAALFRRLPLHPRIEAAMSAVSGFDLSAAAGFHLRRGDFVDGLAFADGRLIDSGLFARRDLQDRPHVTRGIISFVAKYLPDRVVHRLAAGAGRPVVFFSDVAEVRQSFERAHATAISQVHAILDDQDLTVLQRAMCDLILLSRTAAIFASRSNYSYLAALIGGVERILVHDQLLAMDAVDDVRTLISRSALSAEDRGALFQMLMREYQSVFTKRGSPDQALICEALAASG
jgi:hypothetical protein